MSEVFVYILNSGAWSIGGLVVGFFLGRTTVEVHEIKQQLEKEHDDGEQ